MIEKDKKTEKTVYYYLIQAIYINSDSFVNTNQPAHFKQFEKLPKEMISNLFIYFQMNFFQEMIMLSMHTNNYQ